MPELPEVETIARHLNEREVTNTPITDVAVFWEKTIDGISAETFRSTMVGCEIMHASRRAKWLILELNNDKFLLVHLRMTGNFRVTDREEPEKHDRIILDFKNGKRLHYRDTRKFGRWKLVDDLASAFEKIGPEPLGEDFSADWLYNNLKRYKRMIKPLLLDQGFLAGLGNIYVDEALFDSRIHPTRIANTISKKEAECLFSSIQKVLRNSIENQGTSLGNGLGNYGFSEGKRGRNQLQLKVFQRTGQPCFECGKPVERIIVGQRSTHFCANCQK